MPLKQHEFYVYYQENRVLARRRDEEPVVAETLESPQAAADRVQEIVNPGHQPASAFGRRGYGSILFQRKISGRCKAYVEAAYAKGAN